MFSSGTKILSELPVSTPGESLSTPRDRGEKLADLLTSMKLKLIKLSAEKEKKNVDYKYENEVERKSETAHKINKKSNEEESILQCYTLDPINEIEIIENKRDRQIRNEVISNEDNKFNFVDRIKIVTM